MGREALLHLLCHFFLREEATEKSSAYQSQGWEECFTLVVDQNKSIKTRKAI